MEKKFGHKSFTRFKKGDIRELELLYLTYYSYVEFHTFCLPDSDPRKEGIIVNIFFKAWERREAFKDLQHLKRFFRVITLRACLSHLRDNAREKNAPEGKKYLSETTGEETDLEEEHSKTLEKLYIHLAGLTFINRLIIKLAFEEDKSNVEIGRILNLSTNVVGIRKHRVLKLLKTQMSRSGWG